MLEVYLKCHIIIFLSCSQGFGVKCGIYHIFSICGFKAPLFKGLYKVGYIFTFYSKTLGATPIPRSTPKSLEQFQNPENSHSSLTEYWTEKDG